MAAGTKAPPITLEGPPELLEGLVAVGAPLTPPIFTVDLPEAGATILGQMEPAATHATWLRLALPETTPAGEYAGTVRLGDLDQPVRLVVEEAPRLVFGRTSLRLAGPPGGEIPFSIMVLNVGNAPVTLGRAAAVGLFETDAIARRIHDGLRQREVRGGERLDVILEGLADSDGGLARIAIRKGSGKLAPGEGKTVEASLRIDERARPGTTYEAEWLLEGAHLALQIHIDEGEGPS